MASIRRELVVEVSADAAWAAVRDVGNAHRLFRGVLVDARLEGDARVVTFANGMVLRELIVDVDDDARRLVYASVGGRTSHHNASMQVIPEGRERSRLIWITDFLPGELHGSIAQLVDAGIAAAKSSLEGTGQAPTA
ncbi:MAG TPA: SRPBCC family protein [Gemmatimonadaceae bacterium]|jgi:carbon monoxide dehydrogenase subunit G|nr:SRPBCC family protein [Gemmatimonadaceae bacterium]